MKLSKEKEKELNKVLEEINKFLHENDIGYTSLTGINSIEVNIHEVKEPLFIIKKIPNADSFGFFSKDDTLYSHWKDAAMRRLEPTEEDIDFGIYSPIDPLKTSLIKAFLNKDSEGCDNYAI